MSRRGWALFAAMGVIWGLPYLLIKVADGGVAVPVLVLARVSMGALLLLPVAAARGQLGALRGRLRWLALFAAVEIIVPWATLSDAERHLSSSMSGLLIAAVPVIGLVAARLTGAAERLTLTRWAGLLAGVAGVALLAGPGALGGGAWPVAEVLVTALCYATGPLIAARKLAGLPGLAVNAVCLSFASLVYAPAAAFAWPPAAPSGQVLAALAGLGVICTALAFLLFFKLIEEVGPARSTVITYLNPAVAVALGVTVLGEPLTPAMAVAFVLILAGSVLATRSGTPRRALPAPAAGAVPAPVGGAVGDAVARETVAGGGEQPESTARCH